MLFIDARANAAITFVVAWYRRDSPDWKANLSQDRRRLPFGLFKLLA